MKRIIMLLLFMVIAVASFGQDTFVATLYTDNGKDFHALEKVREYVLFKEANGRINFTISSNNQILFDSYLTQSRIVKTTIEDGGRSQTRLLTVVDKTNTAVKRYYLFTVIADKEHGAIRNFIITNVVNNIAKRSYLGKTN